MWMHVHYRCWLWDVCRYSCMPGVCVFPVSPFPGLDVYVYNHVWFFFNGWCALVCVWVVVHPCELLGISGSRPSSLFCSLRPLLLASLSSPVLLCCCMLCVQLYSILLYSILFYSLAESLTKCNPCKEICQCIFYDTDNSFWLWPIDIQIWILGWFNCVTLNSGVLKALFLYHVSHKLFLLP